MAIDPTDSDILYVATHFGLFRSDGDDGWTAVTKNPFDMMGFTMHPSDPKIMYASGHPRMGGLLGFAQSTNGGQDWDVIALDGQVDFHAMTVSLAQPETIWGYFRGGLRRSEDAGQSWAGASASPPQMSGMASGADNPDILFAAGPAGLHRSANGGDAFQPMAAAGGAATVVATTKANPDLLVAYFESGGLGQSLDGGATWQSLNQTFGGNDGAAAIAIDPQDPSTIYVGSYRALIRKTIDGGATWADIL